ncbi:MULTISPECIES: signal peptidase I [unclassified Microbacterium]|uniref:signal peptidase I n=1 Tax=unclassified Microbacterium TaxID=2609290 RepID=UPI001992F3A9|nr:signal peptidase I [Microbacterium sp.]MBD3758185.1 signal peptidase I [Microbacterium sp.]
MSDEAPTAPDHRDDAEAPLAPESDTRPVRPRDRPRRGGVLKLVLTSVAAALLAVIVGIGILVIVVPAVTGSTALTVLTSSMSPALPAGTMVVVRPTDPADIEPGMVMTYQLHSGEPDLVTHRVTQRLTSTEGEFLFITQGDANDNPDPDPVREVQVRGTVWYAIPYLGWVATAVTGDQRQVVITVVVIVLLGYAAWAFGSSLRDRVRKRQRTE